MKYAKIIADGYFATIGRNINGTEITEAEYNEILSVIHNKPEETETIGYRLKTDLTWESYEKESQPEPDLTADEIVDIIFGGAS